MEQLTFLDDQIIDHYRVSTDRAVFGLTSVNGRITNAPPMAKWANGVPTNTVLAWYAKKGATIERTNKPRPDGSRTEWETLAPPDPADPDAA